MNETEWIKKADDDLRMAESIIQIENPPTWGVCFHSQQVAEKYLKAYLILHDIKFEEVHDLVYLLRLCINVEPDFEKIRNECEILNPYSATPRYPFIDLKGYTIEEAKESIEKARKVKEFIRNKLNK